ncbi:YgdI/YgdR family lipoprotein [Roseateles albus]|uniref:YgdI/YgdR family lipoprotein n=1 Tax=Roseateles albus TaxID=2987525 RepID=A0ABT5KKW0_9BURK|nr:YgdI/YgdR family lipoprotein [Roseateles albus]MDC8774089.1 YgdI/YgdR family lipoprotein [Roseateles albus]
MKLSASICLVLLAALAGCSSTQYIMSTKEGRMIVSHGKPDLDEKAGSYEYRDADGKRVTIMKSDVVQIMER